MTPMALNTLAGLVVGPVKAQAETFVKAAEKMGIVGLEVGMDAEKVIVTAPYEAAVAEYGDGVTGSSAWVEQTVLSLGGHLA